MNDSKRDTDDRQAGISRRAFFKGAGVSAAGAAILESPLGCTTRELTRRAGAKSLGPERMPLSLSVNGRTYTPEVDPGMTLVEVLREELGLTGTKVGCDRGACSACTVWIDGEVFASCMTLALDVRDKHITTIEGLAKDGKLHVVQQAFVEHDAMQCGFCTSGMVMSCAALVERHPRCNLDDVKAAVGGHLCRCGTYPNVFKATLAAAAGMRAEGAQKNGKARAT